MSSNKEMRQLNDRKESLRFNCYGSVFTTTVLLIGIIATILLTDSASLTAALVVIAALSMLFTFWQMWRLRELETEFRNENRARFGLDPVDED